MSLARFLAVSLLFGTTSCADPGPTNLVAHALGGIDKVKYTNSLEAFEESVDEGYRWLEVDLSLTSDGRAVCFHAEREDHLGLYGRTIGEITSEEFVRLKYDDKYTLLTFRELLERLDEVPEIQLITDTREWTDELHSALNADILAVNPLLRKRIIPQIYRFSDWEFVERSEEIYGERPSVVFTLYQTEVTNTEIVEFIEEHPVELVVASSKDANRLDSSLLDGVRAQGVAVFAHTVNKKRELQHLQERQEIDGIYTDFLLDSDLE